MSKVEDLEDSGFEAGHAVRRSGVSVVIAGLVVGGILSAGAIAWLPAKDLLANSDRSKLTVFRALLPEGWSFFTKSPRGELVRPYVKSQDGWYLASRGPNNQVRYAFGIDRTSRLTEFDLENVLPSIQDDWWQPCPAPSSDIECLDRGEAHSVQARDGGSGRLCGEVGISKRPPLPWAYRNSIDQMPGQVVKARVACTTR